MIILETNVNYVQVLISKLSQELALKDLQTLYYFMGRLFVTQASFIK